MYVLARALYWRTRGLLSGGFSGESRGAISML